MTTKVNYRSDFDFILRLVDQDGIPIGIPAYDWSLSVYTNSRINAFMAYSLNGENRNWYLDGNDIHIVVDSHRLSPGKLHIDFLASMPNASYPDGEQYTVVPLDPDVELVNYAAPCPSQSEIILTVPSAIITAYDIAVKAGYEGSREDYIEACRQLPESVEQAVQARMDIEAANKAIDDNEAMRIIAESNRASAEQLREAAEMLRQTAEEERVMAEAERAEAAALRCVQFDFGEASTMAKDFNHSGCDIEVLSLMSDNIASITVMAKDGLRQFAVADFAPFVIAKGALSVWEITRQADGEAAALSVKYRLLMPMPD